MASPALDVEEITPESPPEGACTEAQKWIEQVTGRSFGDKDFRTGLENGILLCELLNAIKPGLIKKINRLPTPIAGLDNVTLFLRGCKELGLKESQLFDPGDLQDTSNRTVRISDCNRKLRNVLVTVYWLGKAANSCVSYSGNHLDLKEFEGLLAQMRKENEEVESPKRSIRDSGYIDCWDSERSDSLSPPRHGRDDSFDSLDSFGSRSQQTPSPDVVLRGSSDGRGSDSESDQPNRRLPDVRKDDMSARRVSFGENKIIVPFNQYLPNKCNQTSYLPAPLRKKRVEHDYRKSWSTATSPLGGERPFSPNHPEAIEEERGEGQNGEDGASSLIKGQLGITEKCKEYFDQQENDLKEQPLVSEEEEARKLKSLQKVGIKVMPAAKRYSSPKQCAEDHETPEIVLRKESSHPANEDSEEEEECRMPDIARDDLATRRARMNQPKVSTPFNQYIGSYIAKTKPSQDSSTATTASFKRDGDKSKEESQDQPVEKEIIQKENLAQRHIDNVSDQEEEEKVPDIQRDDLAKRKTHGSVAQQKESLVFGNSSITKADLATWQRLKLSSEESESMTAKQMPSNAKEPKIDATRAASDDFGRRKLSLQEKRARNKQKFVHFGQVTEIDQKRWDRLCIAKPGISEANDSDGIASDITCAKAVISDTALIVQTMDTVPVTHLQCELRCTAEVEKIPDASTVNCPQGPLPDTQRDDMLARRIGTFQKCAKVGHPSLTTGDNQENIHNGNLKIQKAKVKENKQPLQDDDQLLSKDIFPEVTADMKPNVNEKTETDAVQLNSAEDACKEDTSLQKDRSTPDPEKDDMMVRRISVSQRPPGVTLTHFLPVPFSLQKTEEKSQILQPKEKPPISSLFMTTITPNNASQALTTVRSDSPSKTIQQSAAEEPTELRDLMCQPACNPIENNPICAELKSQPPQETFESPDREVPRFSTQSSLSDDTESVSMCDMRYEEEGCMLPHSRAHHENLQFVNDLLKEEDDTWQDDLARWKTRRRSASQDLLKKEEERKKMERLLSGEPDLSERRKSIKTYKEIVEEKERREKDLHEAYKNARTREEAEKILQKYIERFTISEAVLERLVMPKILERSHSVEPGLLSSSEDPNPLKYLRQQSTPSPKFTSTVEATISPTSELDFKAPMGPISPTKNVVSKAVPMLTPKPYSQPRNTQHVLKTFKVEGKVSMNGEAMNGTEEHKEIGSSGVQMFSPSLTRSQMFEGVARVDAPATVLKPDTSSIELSLKRPNIQNSVKDKEILSGERNCSDVVDGTHSSLPTYVHNEQTAEGITQHNKEKPIVTSLEFTPPLALPEAVVNGKDQEEEQKVDPKSLSLDFSIKKEKETALHQVKATQDNGQEPLRKEQHGDPESRGSSAVPIPALNSPSRFCSWDPEEERRRQERWQQEQERLLQERYQKEQEKLKEEWEKAQKEVEEEERKYYEEERKIIEDTLMPLTVSPATSLHRGVCEMNGSTTPSHREQETTSEETWTDAKSCVKEAAQPEDNKSQVPLWTLEGALNRPEEQNNGSRLETEEMVAVTYDDNYTHHQQCNTPTSLHLQFGATLESHVAEDVASFNNFVDSKSSQPIRSPCVDSKGLDSPENPRDIINSSQSTSQGQSPNRSVSGKKLCSTCGIPLGKGAAMIIETLSLFFHIQCFKCGICKGQLGDATTGTDVRIRNGLLNCNDCYIRSRTAGHPTPL